MNLYNFQGVLSLSSTKVLFGMNIIDSYLNQFSQQTFSGKFICYMILIALGFGLISGAYYFYMLQSLRKEIKQQYGKDLEEVKFKNKYLNISLARYKEAKERNSNNVDLQSILDKQTSKRINIIREINKFLPGLMISLGLLGTFIGLSGTISNLAGSLGESPTFQDINEIVALITDPLSQMSTAFVTSMTGLICSIVMGLFRSGIIINAEDITYNTVVDFFENEIGVQFENGLDRAIVKFHDGLTRSIDGFSENVRNLSLNMELSATSVNNGIEGLNKAIQQMNQPINTFKESINQFNNSCETLEKQTKVVRELSIIMGQELGDKLQDGIKNFITNMDNGMERFTQRIDLAAETLSVAMSAGLNPLNDIITAMKVSLDKSIAGNDAMQKALSTLNETYSEYLKNNESITLQTERVNTLLDTTSQEIRSLSSTVANTMRDTFENAALLITTKNSESVSDIMTKMSNDMSKNILETHSNVELLKNDMTIILNNFNISLEKIIKTVSDDHHNTHSEHIKSMTGISDHIKNNNEEHKKSMSDVLTNITASYQDYQTNIKTFQLMAENLQKSINYISKIQIES